MIIILVMNQLSTIDSTTIRLHMHTNELKSTLWTKQKQNSMKEGVEFKLIELDKFNSNTDINISIIIITIIGIGSGNCQCSTIPFRQ